MSSKTQSLHCLTLTSDLFSQALISSFESATSCVPPSPPRTPKYLPEMSSDNRTMLQLYDARAFTSSSYPASDNDVTVAPREIYTEPEAASQVIGSPKGKIQPRIFDSTVFRWLYMEENCSTPTADPRVADELIDLQLQEPVEGKAIVPPGFKCRYGDCHGKDGREKIYARAEHRNRHERTVHRKTVHAVYRCWVRNCRSKSFTRADNLKAHLTVRHGRKPKLGRYQYIATLDKSSSYYDPEWTGDVTSDGRPK